MPPVTVLYAPVAYLARCLRESCPRYAFALTLRQTLFSMVVYKVYRAKFKTRLGTRRVYVGHTKCICIRKNWAEKEPPAAMRCRDPRELSYTIIEDGIETKAQALALEALYAARHIMAEPDICRGGPWSNESLSDNQKDELQAASRCNSLYKLYELAESDKRGSLYRHLKDLEFIKPDDAPSSTTVVRHLLNHAFSASHAHQSWQLWPPTRPLFKQTLLQSKYQRTKQTRRLRSV